MHLTRVDRLGCKVARVTRWLHVLASTNTKLARVIKLTRASIITWAPMFVSFPSADLRTLTDAARLRVSYNYYQEFYDDDDSGDEAFFAKGMKPAASSISQRYHVNGDNCELEALSKANYGALLIGQCCYVCQPDSEWDIPSKLWPFHYITTSWKESILTKGIGDKRLKSFLSDENLVNGSPNASLGTRWSRGHEFWEGIVNDTGVKAVFFSGDSIDELCEMLAEQCTQTPKAAIKPDSDMSLRTKSAIERKSLRALHPKDTNELRTTIDHATGHYFSLMLAQSRAGWAQMVNWGGTALAMKTQRYEAEERIALEIGWALLQYKLVEGQLMEREDIQHVRKSDSTQTIKQFLLNAAMFGDVSVIKENAAYKNLTKYPDNRNHFGYGTSIHGKESQVLQQLGLLIDMLSKDGPVMLIFHDASTEIGYLDGDDMDVRNWLHAFPANVHEKTTLDKNGDPDTARYPIIIQDTQRLYSAYKTVPQFASTPLSRALQEEQIECPRMYNAGNDAYYILQLYHRLMEAPSGCVI